MLFESLEEHLGSPIHGLVRAAGFVRCHKISSIDVGFRLGAVRPTD